MIVRVDYKLVIAFVITIFLFVVMVAITVHNNQKNMALSKEVESTNYLMKHLEELSQHTQSVVSSYRSYVFFQSEEYIKNFVNEKSRLDSTKNHLLQISQANPELSDSIISLLVLTETIVQHGKEVIRDVQDNNDRSAFLSQNMEINNKLNEFLSAVLNLENEGRKRLRGLESLQRETSESAIKRNNIYAGMCLILVITIFSLLQRDMNKRRIMEDQLRLFNARLEQDVAKKTAEVNQVFERVSDGYFLFNTSGICTYVNAQAVVQLEVPKNQIIGRHFSELYRVDEEIPKSHRFDVLMQTKANVYSEIREIKTGKTFEYYAYPFEEGMSIFLRDVTEVKKAKEELIRSNEKFKLINEQLRNLSIYLQKVREDERSHIAREIHDELGQLLTGIKLDLSWVKSKEPELSEEVTNRLNAAVELTNNAIRSVRKIATDLRPVVLDDFGLIAAIEWQAKQFAERTQLKIDLHLPETEWSFSKDFSTIVFRICQEALTNVARHAHATEVTLSVVIDKGNLILRIADNGVGLTGDKKSGSLGLIGMRERAESLGGTLEIINLQGSGVLLELKIPIDDEVSHSR